MQITDELVIDAPVERVWALTVDVEGWPSVTPTVTSVERLDRGPFGLGSRARLKQPGQRPAVWTVTRFEPDRHFEWSTTTFGIRMTGGHHLEALDGGRTRNTLTLDLTGFGSGVMGKLVGRRIAEAIGKENRGFAAAAGAGSD
jgi:uncharacterized membrane protein